MLNGLLKWKPPRRLGIAANIILGTFGVWLLFLAAIGFRYGMVPSDALDHMTRKLTILRWTDEAVLGIPIAQFWSWCSLLGGLVICAYTIYSATQALASTRDFDSRNA
ncbi:MAG: hypothetical protein M3463_01095 [Verrucomicrobiota bacterium]|nr:hypothetical protein [Verrucomicrobiota bacterium]